MCGDRSRCGGQVAPRSRRARSAELRAAASAARWPAARGDHRAHRRRPPVAGQARRAGRCRPPSAGSSRAPQLGRSVRPRRSARSRRHAVPVHSTSPATLQRAGSTSQHVERRRSRRRAASRSGGHARPAPAGVEHPRGDVGASASRGVSGPLGGCARGRRRCPPTTSMTSAAQVDQHGPRVAPRSSTWQPDGHRRGDRSGHHHERPAELPARSAVCRAPLRAAASTTTVPAVSAAMTRLRTRKRCGAARARAATR